MVKPSKRDNARILLTIPKTMLNSLQELATRKGQSVASMLRLIAAEYLEKEKGG